MNADQLKFECREWLGAAVEHLVVAMAIVTVAIASGGCTQVDSTAKRAAWVGAGTAAGALGGHELGDGDARATAAGAIAGATLTHLALGPDKAVRQEGFDQGYVQGQSDAIKRQYFLRHALERRPLEERSEGRFRTYLLPAPVSSTEGVNTEPGQLAIRVVE